MQTINRPRVVRGTRSAVARALCLALLAACTPGDAPIPTGLSDPADTRTPAGALAAYNGTLAQFSAAFGADADYVASSGLLSDELQDARDIGTHFTSTVAGLDSRVLPELTDPRMGSVGAPVSFSALQRVRGQASEALGLLRDYAQNASPALRGHLYALQGYSEVLLAELYCSGIPLSTLDYDGDYTLKPGSTTDDVLRQAIALFDSALTLAGDSARVLNLARLGRGRALLGLGEFALAAQAVAGVPDGYRYDVSYSAAGGGGVIGQATSFARTGTTSSRPWEYSVSDLEGVNGMDYRASGDPRTAARAIGTNQNGVTLYHPDKYATDGSSPIVLADWVEARLIEAEAQLQANDVATWLGTLNRLRETAIVPALADTSDPGTTGGRIDLLFRERAFWLFLTGHRQGDMRRLIRQYQRSALRVYPIGTYPGGAFSYGNDVTAPIPAAERVSNPLFTGCASRGA